VIRGWRIRCRFRLRQYGAYRSLAVLFVSWQSDGVAILRFVTHAEVLIDPEVPVPLWGLSATGQARTVAMLEQPWLASVVQVVSSGETKAVDTANIVAGKLGVEVLIVEALHENDRSSTGFVPPDRFEEIANEFFASPDDSVLGWETAKHAQDRVIGALAPLLEFAALPDSGDVLVAAHGAVGTLAYCALLGEPIDRRWDQRGGGHYWSYDAVAGTMLHHWHRIDDIAT
jgi:broad specificity phosphatase PhoE